MPKSPDAFRTISEVADWLDKPAHVLRFWESKFTQVKPVKRAGGRRYYRPDDMMLLGGIKKLLHDDGMTIKGVQKVLREQGIKYVTELSQPLDEISAAAVDQPGGSDDRLDDHGPYAAFESAEETPEETTVVAFQRAQDRVAEQEEPHTATSDASAPDTPSEQPPPEPQVTPEPSEQPAEPADDISEALIAPPPPEAAATEETAATGDEETRPVPAKEADPDPAPAVTHTDPDTPAPAGQGEAPLAATSPGQDQDTPAPETLPVFSSAQAPAQETPSEPPQPAAQSRPVVVDIPDVPDLDRIDAPPGLIAAILARRTQLSREDREKLSAAAADLARLRDRMAQIARD